MIETVKPGEIKLSAINRLKDREFINQVIDDCSKVPVVQYTQEPNKNKGGFTQHIISHVKDGYNKSTKTMLSLIHFQPSHETCIYSSLLFVKNQSNYLNVDVPCIAFDQPLCYKTTKIMNDKDLNMICRLSGFNTLMSLLGSIVNYMAGSGIEQALALVYAPNTI